MRIKHYIILCAMLAAYSSWGQGLYDELLRASQSTETTISITRAWKGNAQITYIQDIEYDPYNADEITGSTAKFVYYDPMGNIYKVAEFDNHNWPRVTDFQILEDTLYFCGYANVAASSIKPFYVGFVGSFCIPQLFAGSDVIYSLTFTQQPDGLDNPYWFVNEPCKIEVFKVETGIHLVCTGGWSHTRDSLYSGGYFVADVVHEFEPDNWWYYIHRGHDIERYSDTIVTAMSRFNGTLNNENVNLGIYRSRIPPTANNRWNAAFGTVMLTVAIKEIRESDNLPTLMHHKP